MAGPSRAGSRPLRRGRRSRSAARRFSPMPGIWSSSSTRAEPAVLLAVLEDLLGGGRADAVELVELLERRGVEVDRLLGAAGAAPAAPGAAAPPRSALRDEDLAAVLDLRGAVDLAQVGAPGRRRPRAPARPLRGRWTGSGTRRAGSTAPATSTTTPPAALACDRTSMLAAGGAAAPRRPPPASGPDTTRRGGSGQGRPRPRRPAGGDRVEHGPNLGGPASHVSAGVPSCRNCCQTTSSTRFSARRSSRACSARRSP